MMPLVLSYFAFLQLPPMILSSNCNIAFYASLYEYNILILSAFPISFHP